MRSSTRPSMAMRASEVLDDRTSAYAAAALGCFQKLQDAANRLAGTLVLLAIANSRQALDVEIHQAAAGMVESGLDDFRSLDPTNRAEHFHRHLGAAGNLLRIAVRETSMTLSGSAAARDPLPPLRAAWEHLTNASRHLPGFELVDFQHTCCAMRRR